MVTTVIIYFWLPETKQRSMEELGELFGDEVVVHLTADGEGIVEKDKIDQHEDIPVTGVDMKV